MEIKVQSIKFNADQKLLDFIDKKFSKLSRYYDDVDRIDVALSVEPDHGKKVQARFSIPGNDVVLERCAATFEDAVVALADVAKDQLVKAKEKRAGK